MLEYRAWSAKALQSALAYYAQGEFSVLDLELGGGCNYHCVYCDSPDRGQPCPPRLDLLKQWAEEMPLKWVFICGLGEPLYNDNRRELDQLIGHCASNGISVSMFSNVSQVDSGICDYVRSGCLSVLFKFDSMDPELMSRLYGTSSPLAQLRKVCDLASAVQTSDGTTNLAASIVVTKENLHEIDTLLDFCDEHSIFPLVADLEDSGRGKSAFSRLKLGPDELVALKQSLEARYFNGFSVPVCPSVIGGVHVGATDDVLVDAATGLSCHWFWLTEPHVRMLGKVTDTYSYQNARRDILNYRRDRLDHVKRIIAEYTPLALGGCGGDVKRMLCSYVSIHLDGVTLHDSPEQLEQQ